MTTIRLNSETNRQHIITMLTQAPVDKNLVVKIEKAKRTVEQNDKWHTMVRELAHHMNYTPAEMKCIVKYALGYFHTVKGKTDDLIIYDDTHTMNLEELSELIEYTYQWAAEKGVILA